MSDPAGQQAWSFDSMGRVLADRRTTNSVTGQTNFEYNFIGGVTRITYPFTGNQITYSFNAAARVISAIDNGAAVNYVAQATYGAHGALTGYRNDQGATCEMTSTWSYNNRLQPLTMLASRPVGCGTGDNRILDLTFNYDLDSGPGVANNGSVASVTNNRDSNRTQTYTYDQLNRLKTAEVPTSAPNPWKQVFGYDNWANLTSITVERGTAPALSLSVNTQNRITNTGFSYDTAGNLLADNSHTYAYNAENFMASLDSSSTTYTRDGNDRRVQKSSGTLYWYCLPCGAVLTETDAGGNVQREYIHFNGARVARRDSSGARFYLFSDHLGSLRAMTNSSGVIVQELDYFPFGQAITVASNPATDDPHLFTGHRLDSESSLYYTQYRMLSFHLARWTTTDPACSGAGDPQGHNKYTYVLNNPTNYTDSLGAWVDCKTIGLGTGWTTDTGWFLEDELFTCTIDRNPIPGPIDPFFTFADCNFCFRRCVKTANQWFNWCLNLCKLGLKPLPYPLCIVGCGINLQLNLSYCALEYAACLVLPPTTNLTCTPPIKP